MTRVHSQTNSASSLQASNAKTVAQSLSTISSMGQHLILYDLSTRQLVCVCVWCVGVCGVFLLCLRVCVHVGSHLCGRTQHRTFKFPHLPQHLSFKFASERRASCSRHARWKKNFTTANHWVFVDGKGWAAVNPNLLEDNVERDRAAQLEIGDKFLTETEHLGSPPGFK
jgi:hypothetical protein